MGHGMTSSITPNHDAHLWRGLGVLAVEDATASQTLRALSGMKVKASSSYKKPAWNNLMSASVVLPQYPSSEED